MLQSSRGKSNMPRCGRYDDAMRTEHKIHLDFAPTQCPRHDDEHLDLRKPAERLDSCTRLSICQAESSQEALSLAPADVRDESM